MGLTLSVRTVRYFVSRILSGYFRSGRFRMAKKKRPKLAVYKFASCDGGQLSLLDCEDELLAIAGEIEIANFPEASRAVKPGPYDVTLVEGSITTAHDAERIKEVRRLSGLVVTIGACATAGGIQALRNFQNVTEFISLVYAKPQYIKTLEKSTAIADHIPVDFELRGCPINKMQLIELVTALLAGRKPNVPKHSVCVECKRCGTPCVLVSQGTLCLGPVTQAGCGALCPAYNRGCYGCFGPKETPNTASLSTWFLNQNEADHEALVRVFRTFNADAKPFKEESQAHEK